MLVHKIFLLFISLSFIIYKVNAAYEVSVDGKKLVYTGTKVDHTVTNVVLTSAGVVPDLTIPFTCIVKDDSAVCKSADLDFTKLMGTKATFNGALFTTPKTEKVLSNIPLPPPTNVKWSPSTSPNVPSEITGNFLLFGYGDVKAIVGSINKATKLTTFKVDPVPKDATKFMVLSQSGSGSIELNFDKYRVPVNYASPTVKTATSVGSQISIVGDNFFNSKDLVSVKVGNDVVSSVVSVDQTTLVINYEAKLAGKVSVVVTVNTIQQQVPGSVAFLPAPVSITPPSPKDKSSVLTISGKMLKGFSGDESKIKIMVGAYNCIVVTSSLSEILCKIPPVTAANGSKNLKVVVTIDGAESLNSLVYSYGIPKIDKIEQIEGLFKITGSNLGTKEASKIILTLADKSEVSVTPEDDDDLQKSLIFTLPNKISAADVIVYDGEDKSNSLKVAAMPYISKVLSSPPTKGGVITLGGSFLNPADKGSVSIIDARDKSVECPDFTVNEDGTSATCICAAGCGKVTAKIDIGTASYKVPFSFQEPSKLVATQKSNNSLSITGENLGPNAEFILLNINGKKIVASSLSTDNVLSINLPNDIVSDVQASLIVDGVTGPSSVLNVHLSPVASSISKINTQGGLVNVNGSFFDEKSKIMVKIGSVECASVDVISPTQLSCTAPKGSGVKNLVTVSEVDKEFNETDKLFLAYNPPTVLSATSVEESKGGVVTIYGTNFESTGIIVKIDLHPCSDVSVLDSTKLTCSLPPLSNSPSLIGKKLVVNVTVDGQFGNAEVFEFNRDSLNTPTPVQTNEPKGSSDFVTPSPVIKNVEETNQSNVLSIPYTLSILFLFFISFINI